MKNVVIGRFPASCGELVQGYGLTESFVCSYAIDCYTYVSVSRNDQSISQLANQVYLNKKYPKVIQVLHLLFEDYHYSMDQFFTEIIFDIQSAIPVGKGMGSSTADMVASLCAVAKFMCIDLTMSQVMAYCVTVEPTDSIVYPDLTLTNPNTGALLSEAPSFFSDNILCLEPDATLTTQDYRKLLKLKFMQSYVEQYESLKQETMSAFEKQDLLWLKDLSAKSAILNQIFVKKPYLSELLALEERDGVDGLNIAHSGTVVAIWFNPNRISQMELSQAVQQIDTAHYYTQHHVYRCVPSQIEFLTVK